MKVKFMAFDSALNVVLGLTDVDSHERVSGDTFFVLQVRVVVPYQHHEG